MRQTVYRSFSYYSNFDMCKRFLAFTSIRLIQYVYMPYLSRQQIGFWFQLLLPIIVWTANQQEQVENLGKRAYVFDFIYICSKITHTYIVVLYTASYLVYWCVYRCSYVLTAKIGINRSDRVVWPVEALWPVRQGPTGRSDRSDRYR